MSKLVPRKSFSRYSFYTGWNLPEVRFTVVSRGLACREAPKSAKYCYTVTLENAVKFEKALTIVIP